MAHDALELVRCEQFVENEIASKRIAMACVNAATFAGGPGYVRAWLFLRSVDKRGKRAEDGESVSKLNDVFPAHGGRHSMVCDQFGIGASCRAVHHHVYRKRDTLQVGEQTARNESLGLASIWIHRAKEEFDSEEGKTILAELGVEGDYEGIGHCALGYWGTDKPAAPARNDGRVFSAE